MLSKNQILFHYSLNIWKSSKKCGWLKNMQEIQYYLGYLLKTSCVDYRQSEKEMKKLIY